MFKRTTTALLALSLSILAACSRQDPYPQSSPDEVIETAVAMVENGDAGKLADLVYADSPDMRRALRRFGRLLKQAQSTAKVLAERFPEEAAAANELIEQNGAAIDLSMIRRASDPGGAAYQTLAGVLADPYAFLRDQRDRVQTVWLSDETSAITFDDAPLLPPFGVAIRKAPESDDPSVNTPGDWYVVAPLNIPFVNRFTPRNEDHWMIIAYLFKAWENVLIDIERQVVEGRITSLEQASREAGTMAFPPTIAIVLAYRAAIEEQDGEE